jgi:hypothetical protein
MPGLDSDNQSNGSSHLPSSSPSSSGSATSGSHAQQTIKNRLPGGATSNEWNSNHTTTASSPLSTSPTCRQQASEGSCDSHVTTTNGSIRKFTWKELSQLHQRHNAHVAYRGKVWGCVCVCEWTCMHERACYKANIYMFNVCHNCIQTLVGAKYTSYKLLWECTWADQMSMELYVSVHM